MSPLPLTLWTNSLSLQFDHSRCHRKDCAHQQMVSASLSHNFMLQSMITNDICLQQPVNVPISISWYHVVIDSTGLNLVLEFNSKHVCLAKLTSKRSQYTRACFGRSGEWMAECRRIKKTTALRQWVLRPAAVADLQTTIFSHMLIQDYSFLFLLLSFSDLDSTLSSE